MALFCRASPRLKDASIPMDDVQELYLELVIVVRQMYQTCHLVHADLSEYNILYAFSINLMLSVRANKSSN
jgi:serine/threonine-protein kinase RIO1